MQKIIHITDTHLCPPGGTVLGLDPEARLRTVIRAVNENHGDAALCVVTGDLTDQGQFDAYLLLRDCLAGLRVPHRLLLGNHDARAAFREVFATTDRDDDGFVQSVVEFGQTACILLDTLDEARPADGLLCGRRLAWLDARLAELAASRVLIFMHHPPLSIGLPWFDGMLLANGEALMQCLARHDNVAHIAFGHVHVNTSGVWRGISFSASRGTCHKILSDTAANHADYVDDGAAYDMLLIGDDGVAVHSIEPAGPNTLIGRETPTPDGRGTLDLIGTAGQQRWM